MSSAPIRWTDDVLREAIDTLRRHTKTDDAREELSRILPFRPSRDGLRHAFKAAGLFPPTAYLRNQYAPRTDTPPRIPEPAGRSARFVGDVRKCVQGDPDRDAIERLVRAARKGVSFQDLCDALDMAPARCAALVESARSAGYTIDVAGDSVAWREPAAGTSDDPEDVGVAPVVNGRRIVAVISDTHFGSKYCMREQLVDFLNYAHSRGARHVFHAGDVIDGCYDHGRWELSHHGIDDQIDDALVTLPRLDGLNYHFISGNHDETFTARTGLDTGRAIMDRATARGRKDLHYHGCRGAMLSLDGVRVELWHPRPSRSYALSYHLQNRIRDTPVGHKGDLLFAGHWHVHCSIEQRGVRACSVPCWQGGGSAFARSLSGAPSIGGLLVSWETTGHGTLRHVGVELARYYEREDVRRIDDQQ